MSEIKVNSIKGVAASSAAITVNNTDGTCTANITNNLSNRNLIINGAMLVAQRGTSSTSQDYQTVDRIKSVCSNNDEVATQSQSDVASGTTPYTLGFRKAFKFQNGNQTSGANANDVVRMQYRLEAQDIANSGWNFKSSSSYITLSFWCKSSVAQNFYIQLVSYDGSAYSYTFETGSLTADTWTKVTHSIPGNSNLQFDNDNGLGLDIYWIQYYGTDNTSSSHSLNSWAAYASGSKSPDMTTTWYTTNDATWELTGVQLEVGSVATDFEHRSFGQELQLCNRYYYDVLGPSPETDFAFALGMKYNSTYNFGVVNFPVQMRAVPTLESSTTSNAFYKLIGGTVDDYATHTMSKGGLTGARIFPNSGSDDHGSVGDCMLFHANNTSAAQLRFNAEL